MLSYWEDLPGFIYIRIELDVCPLFFHAKEMTDFCDLICFRQVILKDQTT